MQTALFTACGLLLIGFILRTKLKVLQVLYIPAAVIGGIIGLVIFSLPLAWIPDGVVVEMRRWPGWLISVIFAGLLLEQPVKSFRQNIRLATRQGIVVWIIVLGEVAVGLTATWLVIRQFDTFGDLPASFGQLIEAGFAGGHATAAAMGEIFENYLNFPAGKDLGYIFATIGLIYGVASGIVFVNLGVRRGWTRRGDVEVVRLSGLEARRDPQPVAHGRVRSEVIDPLVFQGLIVAAAFVVGIGLKSAVMWLIPSVVQLFGADQSLRDQIVKYADNMPLFMFTLIGGLLVREAMHFLRIGDLIDPESIRRVMGVAIEFLIVAAIASMKVSVLVRFGWPVALLLGGGFVWTGFCLLVVARRLLPRDYWFELGILNYGMSTGTTAQGMMLLRIIDKDLNSGAAEDYALAAPLSAPFIGGGVITLILLPWLLQTVPIGLVVLGLVLLIAALYWLGAALTGRRRA